MARTRADRGGETPPGARDAQPAPGEHWDGNLEAQHALPAFLRTPLDSTGRDDATLFVIILGISAVLLVAAGLANNALYRDAANGSLRDVGRTLIFKDPSTNEYSISRDIISFVLVVSCAAAFIFLQRQMRFGRPVWIRLRETVASPREDGDGDEDGDDDAGARISAAGVRANQRLQGTGSTKGVVTLALTSVVLAFAYLNAASVWGVYRVVWNRGGEIPPAGENFGEWWASWHTGYLSAGIYMVLLTSVFYFIAVHVIAGVTFVRFFLEIRGSVSYSPDYFNSDGAFGWSYFRRTLRDVYFGLFFYSLIGGCLLLVIAPTGFFVVAGLALVVGLNSLYLIIPLGAIARISKNDKQAKLKSFSDRFRSVRRQSYSPDNMDEVRDFVFLSAHADRLSQVPNGPYRPAALAARLAPSALALIAAIVRLGAS